MNTTVMPHWLMKRATLTPNDLALEFIDGTSLSFKELHDRSKSYAKKLAQLGVKEQTRVAILSTNNVEMIIATHALTYLGAIAVMLNTRLTTKELMYQLTTSKSILLLTTESLRAEKALDFSSINSFAEVANNEEADISLKEEISLQDPCTMMFTSGTTGHPKAVMHTYGNHWWSATSSALNLGLHQDDKWLLPLPLFHIGGFSMLQKSIIYGIPAFIMEKYDSSTLYNVLKEKQITIVSLVTLMLRHLVELLANNNLPKHVRCILLGGGSVPEDLLQVVKKKSIPLFQSYGMTETSSQIVTLSADDALEKLGSSGKPLFPAQVNILHEDARGVGEIVVKGPMVMIGYVDNTKAKLETFTDGWLKTGDLGYFDEEGFLYVVERRSDLIISGGENIYPSEVESALLQIPGVYDAGVFGKSDSTWGAVPVACIVRESETLTEREIIASLKYHLATYKIPKQYYFVEELPRNASNKLMRHRLEFMVEDNL